MFNQEKPASNETLKMNPSDIVFYAQEIKKMIMAKESSPDLFSDLNATKLEQYKEMMPEAYAQAVEELQNPKTQDMDPQVLTMDVISQNLKDAGSNSRLAA